MNCPGWVQYWVTQHPLRRHHLHCYLFSFYLISLCSLFFVPFRWDDTCGLSLSVNLASIKWKFYFLVKRSNSARMKHLRVSLILFKINYSCPSTVCWPHWSISIPKWNRSLKDLFWASAGEPLTFAFEVMTNSKRKLRTRSNKTNLSKCKNHVVTFVWTDKTFLKTIIFQNVADDRH